MVGRLGVCLIAAAALPACGAASRRAPTTGPRAPRPPAVRRCVASDVRLAGDFGAATGNSFGFIRVFDVSRTRCSVVGYPRVAVLSGPPGVSVRGLRVRLHRVKGEGLSGRAVVRDIVLTPGGGRRVDGPSFLIDFDNYCGPTSSARFVARLPGDPRRIPISIAASGDYPFTSVQCLDPKAVLVINVYPFAPDGSGVS